MKVVEPSEIITGKNRADPKEPIRARPWIRFLARFFDYALWAACLGFLHRIFGGQAPFAQYERLVPYEFFTWIPIEAVLLYAWGTTPGKFLLKTKLHQGRRRRIEIAGAFRRSFFVWLRGLGMMIPVVNFFCLLFSYQRLKLFHITSWDREEHIQVIHEPLAEWRIIVAITMVLAAQIILHV